MPAVNEYVEFTICAHFLESAHHICHTLNGLHLFLQTQGTEINDLRNIMGLPGSLFRTGLRPIIAHCRDCLAIA